MINYSSSFREFLRSSDSRIAKILWRIHHNYYYYQHKYKHLVTTSKVDYITFRHDGTISFLPAGKEHKETDSGAWARDGRQNGRPGKVIQKLFTDKMLALIPPKEFEIFSNAYKAEYNGDKYEFVLMDNKDIPAVYCMARVSGGRLGKSCMNDDDGCLDIYKKCKKLKILTLIETSTKKLAGRALVWFIDEETIVMDRIYTAGDFMDDMFLDYAEKNKWYRKKEYTTFECPQDFICPAGKEVKKKWRVPTPVNFDRYPYIDTFCWGDDESLNNYGDGPYTYNDTEGRRDGDARDEWQNDDDDEQGMYDDIDDCYIDDDDAVCIDRGDRRGATTHRNNAVEINGNYYWRGASQVVELSYDDEWHLREDVVWSEKDQEDYPESECVYTVGKDWILRDDATEIDGKWYHDDDTVYSQYHRKDLVKDDAVFSKHHNSWILEDEAIEFRGDWYHEDEVPEEEKELSYVDRDDRAIITSDPNQILLPF